MEFFSNIWEKIKSLKNHSSLVLIFCVVFALGLLVHFPLERFSSVLTSTIQKQTGYIVQLDQMSLALPIGISAENVRIQPPAGMSDQLNITIDTLTLRPSIWAMITYPFRKSLGFSYKANRGKEVWSGSASFGKDYSSLDVSVKNFSYAGLIPLDQNPMFAGQSIDLKTTANIDLSVSGKTIAIQQGNLSEADGSLEIHSKKTDIVAPLVKTLNLSDLTLESKLKKGSLDIKKLSLTAPNVSGKASGKIKLEPFIPNSSLQLEASVKADPSDANLAPLMQMAAGALGAQPGADGTLSLKINGTFNMPTVTP